MTFLNIRIQGDPGPVGVPSWNPARYEAAVVFHLRHVFETRIGRIVRDEISRDLSIVPVRNETSCNAYADPTNFRRGSRNGQPIYYCGDIDQTWIIETGQPMTSSSGQAVRGQGGGTDVRLLFTPGMWTNGHHCVQTGPGGRPDEILLHEMVHAIRFMSGRNECIRAPSGYDTFEEFVGIVITNMYQSERNRPLRRDHQGFTFIIGRERHYTNPDHVALFTRLCRQEPTLTRRLARVPVDACPFNPFLTYY